MTLALPLRLQENYYVVDANYDTIAVLRGDRARGAEIVAAVNSRPALFKAAKNALLLLRSIDDSEELYGPEMDQLDAAIAAAEGEP